MSRLLNHLVVTLIIACYLFACLLGGCDTIVDYFNISKFFVKLFEFFLFISKIVKYPEKCLYDPWA